MSELTHLIICKNPKALEHLEREIVLVGHHSRNGVPVSQGDALVARDELKEAGFEKTKIPEFLLFGTIPGNICSVFQKKLHQGERVEMGKWGVVVY